MKTNNCLMFDFGGVIGSDGAIVPGMKEVIIEAAAEYNLIIVTSMYSESVRSFLKNYDLDKYFLDILGYDVSPSKTEKIRAAMIENSFQPDKCVMITDTTGDVQEAHEAGIKVIAVTWGLVDEGGLKSSKPEEIVTSPSQIILKAKKLMLID